MTKFVGKLAKMGIAKEAVRGTAEGEGNAKYAKHISIEMNDKVEVIKDESSAGVLANATGSAVNQKFAEGSFEGNIGDDTMGLFMLGLFGQSPTTSDNADGTKTHAFNFAQTSQHQSLTIFLADEVQDYKFANSMISSLSLDVELGKFAMVNAGFLAKAGEEATLTPAYSAENNFLPGNVEVKMADNIAGLDGATKMCARSLSISIDKGLEKDQCLGDADINDILNGVVTVSGSFEMLYQAKTMHDIMVNDVEKALRLTMENTAVDIGTRHPKFSLDLNKVKFTDVSKAYENTAMAKISVEFEAFYKIEDGAIMTAELTNETASY